MHMIIIIITIIIILLILIITNKILTNENVYKLLS